MRNVHGRLMQWVSGPESKATIEYRAKPRVITNDKVVDFGIEGEPNGLTRVGLEHEPGRLVSSGTDITQGNTGPPTLEDEVPVPNVITDSFIRRNLEEVQPRVIRHQGLVGNVGEIRHTGESITERGIRGA